MLSNKVTNGNGITSSSDDCETPIKQEREETSHNIRFNDTGTDNTSDDDEDEDMGLSDEGDLSDNEIEISFSVPYYLGLETSVSCSNLFVLHVSGTQGPNPKMAVALTDNTCSIYDVEQLSKVSSIKGHKSIISNIRFSPLNDSLLYSSSLDGRLNLWDLRTENKCVNEFKDNTDGDDRLKPLTCFDVSCTDRYLCAGTELIGADAFLLYWDVRTKGLLGGYWESHTDDVTQVSFHPTIQNTLVSGSTDGLINVFDIGLESEDDALQQCLNTESSVSKLGWFSRGGSMSALSCITHTEHLQLWDSDGAAPFLQVNREKLTRSLLRNPSDNSYLVNVHRMRESEDLMVLAGSAAGNGQCLRTLRISGTAVTPMSDLVGNRQIVRASWFNEANDVLVTGGESGFLSIWKPGQAPDVPATHSERKALSRVKHNLTSHTSKSKPY